LRDVQPRKAVQSASHRVLFEPEEDGLRCDVCRAPLRDEEGVEGADEIGGRGLLVWTRGDHVHREEPVLCVECGTAVGLAQVRRWEEEDDEEG
jgi:hypothetical protein